MNCPTLEPSRIGCSVVDYRLRRYNGRGWKLEKRCRGAVNDTRAVFTLIDPHTVRSSEKFFNTNLIYYLRLPCH